MASANIGPGGLATVVFDDGVAYSFATNLTTADMKTDKWHFYNVGPYKLPTIQPLSIGRPLPFVKPVYIKYVFEVQDTWMALRDYPALEYIDFAGEEFGDPVSTGSKTKVDIFGYVTHQLDSEKRVLINKTTPTHTLHEGYVCRHVWQRGRVVYIQSIGFGTGAYKGPNEFFSKPVWGMVSIRTIRNMSVKYYEIRTGKDGSIATQDPMFEAIPAIPE